MSNDLQTLAINTIRFLSADAVQKANSGHPGLPMGAAPMTYTLWQKHLRHNPKNPGWANRDRFVLSGGHGSMLLYSLLHLTGYDLPLDQLKNFRQWGSHTPGHPEYGDTVGVEATTGPLGQGGANAVGMAIAEAHLAARYNRPGFKIIDHYTYAIVTDGDLMEGVNAEASSLAGHLKLGKLIFLYDDNHISIDGETNLAFTEDRAKRFEAYEWHTQYVADGNDVEAMDKAITAAKADPRPSMILSKNIIGFGMPNKQNTSKAHGEPPGEEELRAAKANLGWPEEPSFLIPGEVLEHFREAVAKGEALQNEWDRKFAAYKTEFPDLAAELALSLEGGLPEDWESALPVFPADQKGMATRASSGKVLNAAAKVVPSLMGGSADLAGSNKTMLEGTPSFQSETPEGRNFHFGVREHGMAAILNGMSVHGGIIPYGGTFLVFSDYMRGAIRLSALSGYPVIYVLTHDSIGLGEDGPTHQPVEHLAALRAIPGLIVLRPGDANEVRESWRVAIETRHHPTVLALTRQAVPTLDRDIFAPAENLEKGAYILADIGDGDPEIILMATGSEVSLIVDAGLRLATEGNSVRIVSFPSWELFETQSETYKNEVFPPKVTHRIAVEAGISQGWHKYLGAHGRMIGLDRFGASAPAEVLYVKFGITVENIIKTALDMMEIR